MRYAIILVLIGLAGAAVAADSPWLYGIHWYGDPADDGVEVMTGGKPIWVLEIILTEDTGEWSLNHQLAKFQTIVDRGHTLIIRIHPRWNLVVPGPNTPQTAVRDRMETFLPKLTNAAQQLSGLCHIWQIGNEMNLGFEYDIGNLTPQLYVEKYLEIRDAIHAVPSSLGPQIVLLGPVAPVDNAYLGAMCDALIARGEEPDAFAMHAYGGTRGFWIPDIASQTSTIDGKGFADKAVYLTEWGAPTDPISDTNEAGTAQFLHWALVQLADYNANPSNHPVTCACWFVYKYDSYWRTWSILYMKNLHPPGINSDLYDAYRYACTLDLPAGGNRAPTAIASAGPTSGEAPLAVFFDASGSSDPDSGDTLSYAWDFDDGTPGSTSSSLWHTFTKAGAYSVVLTVSDNHGAIDTDTVPIQVSTPGFPPGDCDQDYDVDLDDFGRFQRCLKGPGVIQDDPDCGCARLDGDVDVDQEDLNVFLKCMSGANQPADPDCAS